MNLSPVSIFAYLIHQHIEIHSISITSRYFRAIKDSEITDMADQTKGTFPKGISLT